MTSYAAPRSPAFAAAGSEYMPSSSSTGVAAAAVSGPPTLVAPRGDQAIPAYLLHSSHHTLFQVGGSPLATSYSAPTVHNQPYLDRLQERISSGGALVRRERIPLPSRLDVKQCCKRLLVTGDTKVQFVPERDEQGRESKSVPGDTAGGAPSSRRRRIPQNDDSEDDEYLTALAFSSSKLNRNDPDKDAASVRADQPIPPQAGVYYFEVTVISRGQKGYIGVGFSTRNVDLERLPGWNTESYGYHGDDGKAFASSGTGQAYGPRFTSGDVIGCGIDFVARRAFFVKNGQWLGYVFDLTSALRDPATAGGAGQDPDLPPAQPGSRRERERERERKAKEAQGRLRFYPTIGLQTVGETVKVNFGQDKFVFDIESFVKRRQQETTEEVLSFRIPLEYKHMLSTRRSQPIASGSSGPPMLAPTQLSLLPLAASLAAEDKSTFPDDASDTHLRTALENLISGYLNHQGFTATSRAFRKQRAEEKSDWADLLVPSESVSGGLGATAQTGASTPSTTATKEKKGKAGSKPSSTKKKASSALASTSAAPGTDSGDDGSGAVRMMKSAIRTTLGSGERSEVDQVHEEGATAGRSSIVSSADASGSGTPVASSRGRGQPSERRRVDSRADLDMPDVRDDLMLSDLPADATADSREKGSARTPAELAEEHEEAELLDTALRQRICARIRSGDIDGAMKRLEEGFAEVLHPSRNTNSLSGTMRSAGKSSTPGFASGSGLPMAAGGGADIDMDILFRLRCRKFVELALRSCDGELAADEVVDDLMNIDDEDEEVASALISSRHSTPGSGLLLERDRATARSGIKTKGKGKERVGERDADGSVAAHDDNAEEIDRDEMMDDEEEGAEVEDVLTYGATLSALYPRTLSTPQTREYLDTIFSLVAYGDPRSAPRAEIRALCEQARRDELADAVNRAMLECKGRPGIPDLERVLRQAIATKEVLGEVFGEPRAALVGDVLGL